MKEAPASRCWRRRKDDADLVARYQSTCIVPCCALTAILCSSNQFSRLGDGERTQSFGDVKQEPIIVGRVPYSKRLQPTTRQGSGIITTSHPLESCQASPPFHIAPQHLPRLPASVIQVDVKFRWGWFDVSCSKQRV